MTIKASPYLSVDSKQRGYSFFGLPPPPGVSQYGGSSIVCNIDIASGREATGLTLDEASFELVECPTGLSTEDFYKIQQGNGKLRENYEDEVTTFVKEKLGCDKLICFHSQVRNAQQEGKAPGVEGYAVGAPHTDSSALSGDELALNMLANTDQSASDYKRFLYLNLWRNISDDPIEDQPCSMRELQSNLTITFPAIYSCRQIDMLSSTA